MTENYTLLFHGQWAPFHAVSGTPLLVAFELLLCIYLEHSYGTRSALLIHNDQKILLAQFLNHFIQIYHINVVIKTDQPYYLLSLKLIVVSYVPY